MAAQDTNIPRVFHGAAAVTLSDGSNSISLMFMGTFSWNSTGRTKNEARDRGRHKATPVATEGEDGNTSLSFSGKVTSYLGSSNTHAYEVFTRSGNASGWGSTVAGNADGTRVTYTSLSGESGGGNQSLVFGYCLLDSIDIDMNGEGGHETWEVSMTDLENFPTPS